MASTAPTVDDSLAGLKIIDVDSHLSEPADLWTSRAPARYRDLVPRQREINGRTRWIVGDDIDLGGTGASSVVDRDREKMYGVAWMKLPASEVHAASSQPSARAAMLDQLGIHAQVMYPNLAGFGNQAFLRVGDEEELTVGVRKNNRALVPALTNQIATLGDRPLQADKKVSNRGDRSQTTGQSGDVRRAAGDGQRRSAGRATGE